MIDRLWHIKFYSQFPVPGNQIGAYFDDKEAALRIMERHAVGLSVKVGEACETMVFDDLLARYCFRPDFFPCAVLYEMGPTELMWKEIDEKMKASQRAAGTNKEMGFAGGEQKKEAE